jgi:hypothetical protein
MVIYTAGLDKRSEKLLRKLAEVNDISITVVLEILSHLAEPDSALMQAFIREAENLKRHGSEETKAELSKRRSREHMTGIEIILGHDRIRQLTRQEVREVEAELAQEAQDGA